MDVGRLPNFLIIGAMKAGTSSLAHYLAAHPEVFLPPQKELYFFSSNANYGKGLAWYAEHFRGSDGYRAVGEATPHYMLVPSAAARISATLPGVRLVAILRNPADRAWSQYWQNRIWFGERRDFITAVRSETPGNPGSSGYLAGGFYLEQLQRFCSLVPRKSLYVLLSEDMNSEPKQTYRRVCEFLEIDPTVVPAVLGAPYNYPTRVRSPKLYFKLARFRYARGHLGDLTRAIDEWNLDHALPVSYPALPRLWREELEAWYRDANLALADWLGRDLSHWGASA